jgi:hypothetical protein
MNKSQINKSRMFGSVDLVLDNHSQIFSQLEDMVLAHQRLKNGIDLLGQHRQVQETDNTGLTDNKIDLRLNLINHILPLSAAIKSHAIFTKNKELKAKASYTRSDLLNAPDPVLYDICLLLLNLATPILPELAKYFVDQQKCDFLETLLANFKAAIPQKRVANSASKVSTANIGEVFNSLTLFLKEEMDVLMLLYQQTNPDFYNEYLNARKIVGYTGPSGDSGNGSPSTPTS